MQGRRAQARRVGASSCSSYGTRRTLPSYPRRTAAACSAAQAGEPAGPRDDGTAAEVPSTSGAPVIAGDELPEELQGLEINEDGLLIDTKTGKVVNEFGATRFDVAVRALRGELSPPEWAEDTERARGNLLGALFNFPRVYTFQVVGRPDARGADALVRDVVEVVAERAQDRELRADDPAAVTVKPRLGGKYVSISVDVTVRAPEIVNMVYDALDKDARLMMKF